MSDCDVLIAGGGLVGAGLASALGGVGARVTVVEPIEPCAPVQPSFDDRHTAIAPTTRRFFEALGLWAELAEQASPIRDIHVSDQGRFGFTRLTAADEGLDALGYVLPNRSLGATVLAALTRHPGVEVLRPAWVTQAEPGAAYVNVYVDGETAPPRTLSTRLLVVAEGVRSPTRDSLGISVRERPYAQAAVVANLRAQRPHGGRAFERFTRDGPLAVLPATAGCCALVWSVPETQATAVAALDDAAFLDRLQARFGWRLGRLLEVGRRQVYPLAAVTAERFVDRRVAVIGNAAHGLHPVAAQGFNLAIRDVAVLAELIRDALACGADPGEAALLSRYERLRRRDYRRTFGFTDALVRTFSNALPGLVFARNASLVALDLLPAARQAVMHRAMGRAGWLPRLARGLPLAEVGRQ